MDVWHIWWGPTRLTQFMPQELMPLDKSRVHNAEVWHDGAWLRILTQQENLRNPCWGITSEKFPGLRNRCFRFWDLRNHCWEIPWSAHGLPELLRCELAKGEAYRRDKGEVSGRIARREAAQAAARCWGQLGGGYYKRVIFKSVCLPVYFFLHTPMYLHVLSCIPWLLVWR